MTTFYFTVHLKEDAADFTEQIYDAGMDDTTPTGGGIMFTREANNFGDAVKGALSDIAKLKQLTVTSVSIDAEDLHIVTHSRASIRS